MVSTGSVSVKYFIEISAKGRAKGATYIHKSQCPTDNEEVTW